MEGRPPDEGDGNLGTLVRLANTGTVSMDVTLWVGGSVVSGLLVGVAEYLDGLAGSLEPAGEGAALLSKFYRDQAEGFRELVGEEFQPAFDAPYTLVHIHLKNARVFSAGGEATPRTCTWWRGRIDRVDAFSIGSLAGTAPARAPAPPPRRARQGSRGLFGLL